MNECLENQWTYKYNEGMIEATCDFCGFEIMFPSKKLRKEKSSEQPLGESAKKLGSTG